MHFQSGETSLLELWIKYPSLRTANDERQLLSSGLLRRAIDGSLVPMGAVSKKKKRTK